MKLKDWMEANKMTGVELAKLLDVSPAYVSSVLAGKKEFSPSIARDIKRITLGRVDFVDLYEEPPSGRSEDPPAA